MTRAELVAALKARAVSESAILAAVNEHGQQVSFHGCPSGLVRPTVVQAAQAADAERLAEALEAALSLAETGGHYDRDGSKRQETLAEARAAFLQSLTGPTTRETERP